jgi:hypothetical protein
MTKLLLSLTSILSLTGGPVVYSIGTITSNETVENSSDLTKSIASQFENDNTDASDVSFQSIFHAISYNSDFVNLRYGLNTRFKISDANDPITYIWYNGYHGSDMVNAYQSKISDLTNNVLAYPLLISVASQLVRYYAPMNTDRSDAIIKNALSLIHELQFLIDSNDSWVNPHGTFSTLLETLDATTIYNDVLQGNFTSDFFTKFENISYSTLISQNVLDAANNEMVADKYSVHQYGLHTVTEHWTLNDGSNNNTMQITFNDHFNYYLQNVVFANLNEFSFSDPNQFDLNIN